MLFYVHVMHVYCMYSGYTIISLYADRGYSGCSGKLLVTCIPYLCTCRMYTDMFVTS